MIDLAGSSSSEDEVEEVEGSPTKVTQKWAPKPKVEPTVLINEDTRMGVPNETPFVSGVEYVEDSLEGLRNVEDPLEDFDFFEFEKKKLKEGDGLPVCNKQTNDDTVIDWIKNTPITFGQDMPFISFDDAPVEDEEFTEDQFQGADQELTGMKPTCGTSRHMYWFYTLFPHMKNDSDEERAKFLTEYNNWLAGRSDIKCYEFCGEVAPSTGRFHVHVLIGFTQTKSYACIKSHYRGKSRETNSFFWYGEVPEPCHISWVEPKNIKRTLDYIRKDRTKCPNIQAIYSHDAAGVFDAVIDKEKDSGGVKRTRDYFNSHLDEIRNLNLRDLDQWFVFNNISKIISYAAVARGPHTPYNHMRGVWIYGEPGSGKTSLFKRWLKPGLWQDRRCGEFWDPWYGQAYIIMDEFTGDSWARMREHVLKAMDRFSFSANVKGSQTYIAHEWFVVISNEDPTHYEQRGHWLLSDMLAVKRRLFCKDFIRIDRNTYDFNNPLEVRNILRTIFAGCYDGTTEEESKEIVDAMIDRDFQLNT